MINISTNERLLPRFVAIILLRWIKNGIIWRILTYLQQKTRGLVSLFSLLPQKTGRFLPSGFTLKSKTSRFQFHRFSTNSKTPRFQFRRFSTKSKTPRFQFHRFFTKSKTPRFFTDITKTSIETDGFRPIFLYIALIYAIFKPNLNLHLPIYTLKSATNIIRGVIYIVFQPNILLLTSNLI